MEDKKIQFLYASISDIQNTIRLIDAKIGFIVVFLLIPLSKLGKITTSFICLYPVYASMWQQLLFFILLFVFAGLWFLAFLCAFKAVSSIDNPAYHIAGYKKMKGTFFSGGLYKLNLADAVINRRSLLSTQNVNEHTAILPQDSAQLIDELTFDQMKLAYIRDIKLFRQKWAYRLTFIWLSVGFAIYMYVFYRTS